MSRALAIAAGLCLALAGCGDESREAAPATSDSTGPTTTRPTAQPSEPPEPIRARNGVAAFRIGDDIGCAISRVSARCDVVDPEWTAPPPDEPCSLDYGSTTAVGAAGAATYSCVSDTVIDPQAPELAPERSVELLGYRCENTGDAAHCINTDTERGFAVSRRTADLF